MKFSLLIFGAALAVAASSSAAGERADLQSEVVRLRAREAELQRRLDDLTRRFQEREKAWRRQRIWMGNLADDARLSAVSEREERLLTGLNELSGTGSALALKSAALCGDLRALLGDVTLGASRRARLQLAIEQVEKAAGKFSALTDLVAVRNPTPGQCRVLAVDSSCGLAVLSIGALHGAVPGMLFRTAGGTVKLRVVAARPYASAATAVSGTLRQLSPGTSLISFTPATGESAGLPFPSNKSTPK